MPENNLNIWTKKIKKSENAGKYSNANSLSKLFSAGLDILGSKI